jgi:hypothetical protein
MQSEVTILGKIKLYLTAPLEVRLLGNCPSTHKRVLKYPTALAHRLPGELCQHLLFLLLSFVVL